MTDEAVSISKITVPLLYVCGMVVTIASAVYAWDDINDRIAIIESKALVHVRIDQLEKAINALSLKRVTDNMAEIQAALNYYHTIEAAGNMTPELRENQNNRMKQMANALTELNTLSVGG